MNAGKVWPRITRITLAVAALLLVVVSPASAVMDNPHSSAAACSKCHASASIWWTDQGATGGICGQCHNSGGNKDAKTHTTSATYGITMPCTSCHNPHYQKQFRTWKASSYLANGTISAVNSTTLTRTGTTPAWTVDQWKDMLLVPNVSYPQYSYRIAGNTDTAITIDTSAGDAINLATAKLGASFAVIYGRLIKEIVGSVPVKFFQKSGANSFADGDVTADGICQVCHTRTGSFTRTGTLEGPGHPSSVAGADCTQCHSHTSSAGGFIANCNNCHGTPPVDAGSLAGFTNPSSTGSVTAGAHDSHVNTQGILCAGCHYDSVGSGSTHNSGNTVTLGFYNFGGSEQGGSYNGQVGVAYDATATSPATTASSGGLKECSNLYCHGSTMAPDGGTDTTPEWDAPSTGACGTCHGATPENSPTRGSHQKHAGRQGFDMGLACALCHNTDSSAHVNGQSDFSFSADSRVAGASYSGTSAMLDAYGACSDLYCHSTVQTSPPGGAPTYLNPTWGMGAGCGSCHKGDGGHTLGNKMDSGSHAKHLTYSLTLSGNSMKCAACHKWNTVNTLAEMETDCDLCHSYLHPLHADGQVYVFLPARFGGAYSGTPAPGDAYGSCDSVYCHSNAGPLDGTQAYQSPSPRWGGSATTCTSCHAASGGGGENLSTRHEDHFTNYNYDCVQCHSDTVSDSTTIRNPGGYSLHVDGAKNVTWGPISSGSSDYGVGPGCSNLYCHSQGTSNSAPFPVPNIAAAWNVTFTDLCKSCHNAAISVSPGDGTDVMATNRHTAHTNNLAVLGSNYNCGACHNPTVTGDADLTGKYANHVNRNIDIGFADSFNSGASYAGAAAPMTKTPGSAAGQCSGLYCHSDGRRDAASRAYRTPGWQDAAWASVCNNCHGTSNTAGAPDYANGGAGAATSNSHAAHVTNASGSFQTDRCAWCHETATSTGTAVSTPPHLDGSPTVGLSGYGGTYSPATRQCSAAACHGSGLDASSPQWGGEATCINCHQAATLGDLRRVAKGGGSSSAGDFVRPSRHVSAGSTTEIVTNFDCIVCHMEGDPASTSANVKIDKNYHPMGPATTNVINLRNVDNYTTGWAIDKTSWNTAARDNMDSFCMACHDSDTSYAGSYVPESGDGRIIWARGTGASAPMTNVYTARSDAFTATEEKPTGVSDPAAAPMYMVLKASPSGKNEMIAGYATASGELEVVCYDGATDTWTKDWTAAIGGTGTTRRFDIAYETQSGDALVLYSTNATTNELAYRTKPSGTGCGSANWSAPSTYEAVTTGVIQWVRLETDTRAASNTIASVWVDANSDLAAAVWNGGAFGNASGVLEQNFAMISTPQDTESFDVAFESLSGNIFIIWGRYDLVNQNNVWHSRFTGSWSSPASYSVTPLTLPVMFDIAPDILTNRLLVGVRGSTSTKAVVWTGSALTAGSGAFGSEAVVAGTKMVAAAWLNNGAFNKGVVIYGYGDYRYITVSMSAGYSGSSVWFYPEPKWGAWKQADFFRDPVNTDRWMLLVSDSNSDIFAKRLVMESDGTVSWTNADDGAIETTTSTTAGRPWAFAFQRTVNSGTRGGGASTIAVNSSNTGLLTSSSCLIPVARRYTPFNTNDTLVSQRENAWTDLNVKKMRMERNIRGRAQRSSESGFNTESKGLLADVRGMFNYRNLPGKQWASHHNLNQFTKRYANASGDQYSYLSTSVWEAYTTKEGAVLNSGSADSGVAAGLHCSDCHLNEVNAHGAQNTWYMTSDRSDSDTLFANTGKTSGTDHCFKCHNRLSYGTGNSSTAARTRSHNSLGAGCSFIAGKSAATSTILSYFGMDSTMEQFTCLACHGGRDFGDIHGTNMRFRVGGGHGGNIGSAGNVTKRYRFMSGSSMKHYTPNYAAGGAVDDTSWEGGSNVGCYTIYSTSDTYRWGSCSQHVSEFTESPANRARPLEY